ncbi:TetR/AcrR family transcriptional regulator [Patulibacter brassicae]|uniref:TetR/AcrR family transcriptional regulator n=1 Tax=Patulibacter brassicae TaxID=1705717 RepID=A0ABU4VMC0_9ACTN|nr:TetR/AcrR family transcriptional regulator [Patulibacter brassicae]MDX8152979.1 TetR/AcrR family transcriptional regulator [Patulibacter brassicae]
MAAAPNRRERKREQTRRALTLAALRLFREQGFEATTVEEIAAASDFHRATFFRVFESKEDVLLGDIVERLEDMRATFRAASPAEDPWAIARRVLTAEATSFEDSDDELDPLRVRLLTTDPVLQPRFTAMTLAWERAVAELFAASAGVDPDTDVTSQVLATAMIGVVRTAMLTASPSGKSARQILEEGFDLLEAGELARGGLTRRSPPL